MKLFIFVLFILLGVFSARPQTVETNSARKLTLQECIELAVEHNFDVRIERYGPEIRRFNLAAAYAIYDPVFEASATHNFNSREGGLNRVTGQSFPSSTTENETLSGDLKGQAPTGLTYDFNSPLSHNTGSSLNRPFDFYEGQAGVTLRQPLLRNFWIDVGRQNILVAKKDLKISEAALTLQLMTVVNRVEQAYYDLIFARENIAVQDKALQLADRLLVENRRRVEVGALAPLDEKQAESQLAISRADLLVARQVYDAQENLLKNLLTDNFREWSNVGIDPAEKLIALPEKFDLVESWRRGVTDRPELRQLKLDLERRDIILRYQRNQLFPALDLVGSYGRNGLDAQATGVLEDERRGNNPFYSYGVVLSFPLSNRGPRNLYHASKAEKAQALLRYKQLEQNILVQIDNAIKTAQTTFQRVDATKTARQYAEAALDAEQKKLENGKSTSFVVLQLQKDLTAARSAEIRAMSDYNKALAQLAFNEGATLENNNLSLRAR